MQSRIRGRRPTRWSRAGALAVLTGLTLACLGHGSSARGQTPPVPSPAPPAPTSPPLPPLPSPEPPAPAVPIHPAIESRLKRQDELIQQLLEQNRRLGEQLQGMSRQLGGNNGNGNGAGAAETDAGQPAEPRVATRPDGLRVAPGPPRNDTSDEGGAGARDNPPEVDPDGDRSAVDPLGSPPRSDSSREGGAGARDNPPETNPTPGRPLAKLPARVSIGPGFVVETEDEEFQLQFHDQTQVEWRIYEQGAMRPANSGFWVARERLIFNGRLTKPLEYEGSIEYSYGAINILNAFLTWHPNDKFLFKGGRFKVPFGYEYYAISNVDLLNPERSLFGINYGLNRMPGAMAYGQLAEKRLDYAVGMFDGPRNQAVDYNADKDVIAYLNVRPFEKSEGLPWLHYFNFGGSVDAGNQANPAVPQALRTSVSQSANPILGQVAPSFLTFNNNVTENGWRTLWSLHLAYYYKRFSLYGEWQTGAVAYGKAGSTARTNLPVDGFYVAAGYFLTGEHVNRRSQVKPLHRFDLRQGKKGWGAWELTGRYSALHLGNQVFTDGLADPNLWSNEAHTVDLGLNWYLNEYVKIYLDWQHSTFGAPVQYAPGRWQSTSDLFWIRGQVYF